MSRIMVRKASPHEQEQALRIALTEPRTNAREVERICQMMQTYLQRCGGSIGGLYVAESAGRIVTACAAMDLPGGVSLLMIPGSALTPSLMATVEDMLSAAASAAGERLKRFAQVLLEPEVSDRVRPHLLAAGFKPLATLQYMQRNAFDPAAVRPVEGATWRTLRLAGEQTFKDIIPRTYIDSRDCPGLTGIRSIEEVIEGHKAAGEFDPDGWYVLQQDGRDAGVLITARTPLRPALELVYCGLVPEARGKGLGRLCVHKAIARARDLSVPTVTLAVDAANEPALRTYGAMGFVAYASRAVWLRVFRRADVDNL